MIVMKTKLLVFAITVTTLSLSCQCSLPAAQHKLILDSQESEVLTDESLSTLIDSSDESLEVDPDEESIDLENKVMNDNYIIGDDGEHGTLFYQNNGKN